MDQEKTVRLTGEETVALTGDPTMPVGGEPTAYLGGGEPTAYLGGAEPTAYLGAGETARVTGDETVTLAGEPTVRVSAQPTVHLAPGAQPTPPVGHSVPPPTYPVPLPATQPARTAIPAPTAEPAPPATRVSGTRYVTGRADERGGGNPPPAPEVRFGPGVPAPPTAPAWRPATPARPRRSPWRLVSSVLSSLLTVALLAAVGLYLWQRFRPLEVTSVAVAVPQAPGDRCDVTVDVAATVRTNGNAGTIRYQWLRSGAEPTAVLTERVGRGQRSVTLHLKWAFSGVGTTTESATINITEPSPMQAQTTVTYNCERG